MATITITPGNTFTATETVTSTKLNDLGSPTAALTAASIGTADIANAAVTSALIADANVTKAKIENISAPLRVLGRTTAGAGVAEEVTINDDDDMANASAITLATDESIKAYIDKFKPNIVQAVKTNIFSILTPSMVFTDIPDLEVTITPKFSNSKILISSTVNSSTNDGSHGTIFRYVKDGSAIALGDINLLFACNHAVDRLVKARDNHARTERELKRIAPLGAIKDLTGLQGAFVVEADCVA